MRLHVPEELVHRLLEDQFPHLADLPIEAIRPDGWDNCSFRLGNEMLVRMPSASGYETQVDKEHTWLPRLAPKLSQRIPAPISIGDPGHGYPWHWSIYGWIDGETLDKSTPGNLTDLGRDLGDFLLSLQACPTEDAPRGGPQNFHRGGHLSVYDRSTREALTLLKDDLHDDCGHPLPATSLEDLWSDALHASWTKPGVFVHGDLSDRNLLLQDGKLVAVIDFGQLGVGDPACDLTLAWTILDDHGRAAFRTKQAHDPETWSRARGWAAWKALQTLRENLESDRYQHDPAPVEQARRTLRRVLAEHHKTV